MSYQFKATRQLGGINVLVYTASPAQMEKNILDFFYVCSIWSAPPNCLDLPFQTKSEMDTNFCRFEFRLSLCLSEFGNSAKNDSRETGYTSCTEYSQRSQHNASTRKNKQTNKDLALRSFDVFPCISCISLSLSLYFLFIYLFINTQFVHFRIKRQYGLPMWPMVKKLQHNLAL